MRRVLTLICLLIAIITITVITAVTITIILQGSYGKNKVLEPKWLGVGARIIVEDIPNEIVPRVNNMLDQTNDSGKVLVVLALVSVFGGIVALITYLTRKCHFRPVPNDLTQPTIDMIKDV